MSAQPSTQNTPSSTAGQRPPQGAEPDHDDALLVDFFNRIATALSTGDAATIASCWAAPALVVGDGGIHAVKSTAEVESFFASAREQYTSQGIRSTRAEIVRVSWVGLRTAIAEVRWPWLDQGNRELGEERTTYTLQTSDEGELKIRVAVTHALPPH